MLVIYPAGAGGKPVDSSLEQNDAQYQELVRQEQERLNRETETFLRAADERGDDDSDRDPWAPCENCPGG